VSVDPELEEPRPATGPAFSDAVTFAFGDAEQGLYGVARVGLADGTASGLAVLFHGSEPVSADAVGAVAVTEPGWEGARAAGVHTTVEEPLTRWTVTYTAADAGFALGFEARTDPARLTAEHAVADIGGMEGYEQVCAVSGTVRVGDAVHEVDCLGQRGHLWGTPDWKRITLARTVTAWLGADRAVTLTAVRPTKAKGHGDEAIAAWVLEGGEPLAVSEPRLSTAYDDGLRQRRAGLELWMGEDEFVRRAAGEVICGTTLDLGRLRLDAAFFRWHMEGRTGIGRYDVLRRADAPE
jgi:hypothetical protein